MWGPSENAADQASEPAFLRRDVAADQRVGILVPMTARIVVAENSGVFLGLLGKAERQIALDETLQSFGHVRRRLVIVDDPLEAVHRRQIFALLQIVAADFHLLAGEMVVREVEFQLRDRK